ncbi:MAG: hypothetical protein HKN47_06990 [Pirellulaceae bacterium]|nr:hypothetical protein [Pirellulaceae bacterium]
MSTTTTSSSQPKVVKQCPQKMHVDPRWQSVQMLPESFIKRRQAKQTFFGWSIIVVVLVAMLAGFTTAFWIRGAKLRSQHAQLVQSARPIEDMRRRVAGLKQSNALHQSWIHWIESAKPDDSVLQALLSVNEATRPDIHPIDITAVEIKLALEHDNATGQVPDWAKSRLLISADVQDRDTTDDWLERLRSSDRISKVDLRLTPGMPLQDTIQIVGEPQSTRVLP